MKGLSKDTAMDMVQKMGWSGDQAEKAAQYDFTYFNHFSLLFLLNSTYFKHISLLILLNSTYFNHFSYSTFNLILLISIILVC